VSFFVVLIVVVVLLFVIGAIAERFTKPAADATPKRPNADKVPHVAIAPSVGTAGSVDLSEDGRSPWRPARKERSRPSDVNQRRTSSPQLVGFSERHGIPLDSFFDAAGLSKAEYARKMEAVGAIIAYNVKPCSRAGHSIRNRYGKCVVCDPKQIAFNQRASEAGSVYAAYSRSKGLVKVGFAKDVRRRHNVLVSHRYAGASDWELFYQSETRDDGGRREIEAHKALAQYAVKGLAYVWDGRTQVAREVYRCTKENAVEALDAVSSSRGP
jgi:hypothetical protein